MCTIIGAVVLAGCTAVSAQSPADAVRTITRSIQPYVAPPPKSQQQSASARTPNPNWPFTSPATPIRPLSEPWSVTTYEGRYVQTWFNGIPLQGGSYGGSISETGSWRTRTDARGGIKRDSRRH